jgi:gag-polyprotein putative aspartyl protease/PAN domain
LFSGRSTGTRYIGTAYFYNPRCGRLSYEVSGPILDNHKRVVVQGRAARLTDDCQVRGYFTDRLEFTYLREADGAINEGNIRKPGQASNQLGEMAPTNLRRQYEGYAFEYHDEPSNTVANLDACISQCDGSPNCSAYTFFLSRRLCRLTTRIDSVLGRNADAVSGFISKASVCIVADPTGTPLNVRAMPAGQRLSVLYNGETVSLHQTSNSGGQAWALVGKLGGRPLGWVFRDYINCEAQIVAQPPSVERPSSGALISIPMQMDGGTYVVPVLINDAITLDFIVDSGAADVSIPADVVMTLMRTGTLRDSDFLGKQTYVLADGSKVPSETFRIRSLRIGNQVLENVNGSVAPVQGSLLLGQSFLGRFKSWSVDNTRHLLVLE